MNLTHLSAGLTSAAVALAALAAVVLIQTTIVLGIGLAVMRLLRRRGAAVESACQRIVLVAALVAPLASAVIGLAVARVRIPVPAFEEAAPRALADDTPQAPIGPLSTQRPGEPLMSDAERPEPAFLSRPEDHRSSLPASGLVLTSGKPSASPAATRESWLRAMAVTFCATWFCVAAVLVGRLAGSLVGARRLISAAVVAEPELIERCEMLARQIGVRLPRLKRSPFVAGPCVFGWWRPVILLPENEAHIDDDVLIHELAHIARRDGFWKTFSEGTAALLWFQPLLWRLKSRMQFCAEEVCDDFVVQSGTDRCAYADRLTRIAEEFAARSREFRIEQVGIGIVSFRSSLGRRVSRILDSRRRLATRAGQKTIAALVCGAAAIVFAVSLFDVDRHPALARAADEPGKTATKTEPGPRSNAPRPPDRSAKLKLAPSIEMSGDVVTVRGTVLGPDGGPLADARISVLHSTYFNSVGTWRLIATATTKSDGAFELVYRRSQYGKKANEADQRGEIRFLVEADGHAFALMYFMEIDAAKPLVFKLLRDFPIRGRVLDLQGQPIASIGVSVAEIWEGNQGSLDSWLEQVRTGKSRWILGRQRPAPVRMHFTSPPRNRDDAWSITDREGRFEIRGIAAECRATLALRGQSIAFQRLEVVTRQMPTLKGRQDGATNPVDPVYGADFTCVASPGRPIEGTVRDVATGKPLAGVRVQVWRFAHPGSGRQSDLVALTDEKGHYRLAGLPFGKRNVLFLTPNDEQPYLMREIEVPDWRVSGPSTFDVELHRGLWITGRATDKVTGKPVLATLYYLPFLTNPFARQLPEFRDGSRGSLGGQPDRYRSHPDGSFRLVGLPGRAVVGARARGNVRYRAGVGASEIAGMDKEGHFPTFYNPIQAGRQSLDVMQEINPREGVDEVKCDLVLDPGQTIHVALVDQRGKPVERAMIQGVAAVDPARPRPAKFDLIGFAAGDKRPVMIYHDKLRIGKFFLLEYTDRTPQSMTVTLEPCAVIRGRVIDRDGIGVKAGVSGSPRPGGDFWPRTEPVDTQSDGKFECVVPPGCRYALSVVTRLDRTWVDDISVEAGKTTDVGDVKIERIK